MTNHRRLRLLTVLAALALASCAAELTPPVAIDTENDSCAFCRMAIWSPKTAGQLVAPGEEPHSFDDLGCLVNYLDEHRDHRPGTVAYVVDHHSGAFVQATKALYTKVPGLETPMGSHLVAHADETSRAADPVVGKLPALPAAQVFEGGTLPGGSG